MIQATTMRFGMIHNTKTRPDNSDKPASRSWTQSNAMLAQERERERERERENERLREIERVRESERKGE